MGSFLFAFAFYRFVGFCRMLKECVCLLGRHDSVLRVNPHLRWWSR